MTKTETAALADSMIGASQKLAAAAKRMKEEAKSLRLGNLHESVQPILWRDHKVSDIKRAAESAISEFGQTVSLVESIY